jgi:hypothetical protein
VVGRVRHWRGADQPRHRAGRGRVVRPGRRRGVGQRRQPGGTGQGAGAGCTGSGRSAPCRRT